MAIADGIPTVGATVIVRVVCDDGPLHPLAVTCMITVPENPSAHVITPVVALMMPALASLMDQFNPVLLLAVVPNAVVVTSFCNLQAGGVPVIAVGVPTVGIKVTVCVAVLLELQPDA